MLGGGFAGLWSAVGAARKLDELGHGPQTAEVTLLNRDAFHTIRVGNYEADLTAVRVPLDDVLGPAGVRRVEGDVASLDLPGQTVVVTSASGPQTLPYDRLVVVGAGLTGIEVATVMPEKLRTVLVQAHLTQAYRVILADHQPWGGADMGAGARPVIEEALAALGVETRVGSEITAIGPAGVRLGSGEGIPAATVVWCAGMRANPLTWLFPVAHDRFGRMPVDAYMRVKGVPEVFAAGDVAWAMLDDHHASVMSCQHSRPMGRFAGHNVVCDLFGLPLLPLRMPWYVTVLDLGAWGTVYTAGWDRQVVTTGQAAKQTKQVINCQPIYPPLPRKRQGILAAAAPVIQQPPERYREPLSVEGVAEPGQHG